MPRKSRTTSTNSGRSSSSQPVPSITTSQPGPSITTNQSIPSSGKVATSNKPSPSNNHPSDNKPSISNQASNNDPSSSSQTSASDSPSFSSQAVPSNNEHSPSTQVTSNACPVNAFTRTGQAVGSTLSISSSSGQPTPSSQPTPSDQHSPSSHPVLTGYRFICLLSGIAYITLKCVFVYLCRPSKYIGTTDLVYFLTSGFGLFWLGLYDSDDCKDSLPQSLHQFLFVNSIWDHNHIPIEDVESGLRPNTPSDHPTITQQDTRLRRNPSFRRSPPARDTCPPLSISSSIHQRGRG